MLPRKANHRKTTYLRTQHMIMVRNTTTWQSSNYGGSKLHFHQRWSPREHILKSLTLEVRSLALASKPTSSRNCQVLGLSLEAYKFLKMPCLKKHFFFEKTWNFAENLQCFCKRTFFFGENLRVVSLILGPGLEHSLGHERVCPRKVGAWFWTILVLKCTCT